MSQEEKKNGSSGALFERYRKIVIGILVLSIVFWMGFDKGREVRSDGKPDSEVDMSLYWKVRDILKENYVSSENLDDDKMLYGSINGMLYSTGDPYTVFLSPEENKKFDEEIRGNFDGIGAELGIKNGLLTIIAPLEGTPASAAGLRPGDKIININGNSAAEMTIDDAVSQIRGVRGTEVTLTIFREGNDNTFDVNVKRDVIIVKSVNFEIKENNIAYIKISRFGDDTSQEFYKALLSTKSMRPNGIILDLRNNPGGYLDSSISIASRMLPKGKTVLIEEDSDKNQKKDYSKGGDLASGIETVILINEGSASASEILAGALNDNRDNVTLVGMKTFGKGSVQELIDLSGGTAVKITVARWLTPNGVQINDNGIKPEIEVDLSNDDFENDRDPQLDKAIELLKK